MLGNDHRLHDEVRDEPGFGLRGFLPFAPTVLLIFWALLRSL